MVQSRMNTGQQYRLKLSREDRLRLSEALRAQVPESDRQYPNHETPGWRLRWYLPEVHELHELSVLNVRLHAPTADVSRLRLTGQDCSRLAAAVRQFIPADLFEKVSARYWWGVPSQHRYWLGYLALYERLNNPRSGGASGLHIDSRQADERAQQEVTA